MSVIIFLAVLVILVLVHEFGHFITAKKFGIRVDEFGIGFPPKLFGKKWGETEYSINAIFAGGFVRIFGEDANEVPEGPDKERSFAGKSKLVQAAVLIAGVFFNVLFAWALFSTAFMIGMPSSLEALVGGEVKEKKLLIVDVVPGSPAETAGFTTGDEILAVSWGETSASSVLTPEAVSAFISSHGSDELHFVLRGVGKETRSVSVTPSLGIAGIEETPAVGISMTTIGIVQLPPHRAIYEGGRFTLEMLAAIAVAIGGFLLSIFTLQADLSQVTGPVGIVGLVGDASSLGLVYLMSFAAIISLHLAIINLLPFPALDGGRLFFVVIETLKGSPIPSRIARGLNTAGFVFLMLLMVLVTFHDISRLFGA